MNKLLPNSKGLIYLPLIVLMLIGIVIGAFLIKNPTNFFPKAQDSNVNREPFSNLIGWAYSPLPETESYQMLQDMLEMKRDGANVVYISHNNRGDLDESINEPGLSYAVYANRNNSEQAKKMLEAVRYALEAAYEADLKVVLAVGYQISMGNEWAKENPDELRKTPWGENMNHFNGGFTASPYSEKYRQDISSYYEWIQSDIISHYPNIIALNIADEPMGSDYSKHAEIASGLDFNSSSPYEIGKFQSGVLADYATWSADKWIQINPNLWITMTFHIERQTPLFPDFERVFSQTPDNFVFSADTHYSDDPYRNLQPNDNLNLLYGMTRTLGHFSKLYNRPLMLWVSANSWGLPNPETSNEGNQNADIVTDTVAEAGGNLGMIMVWGWNIHGQEINKSVSKEIFTYTRDKFAQFLTRETSIDTYPICKHELFTDIGTHKIYHLTRDDYGSVLADKYKLTDKELDFINKPLIYKLEDYTCPDNNTLTQESCSENYWRDELPYSCENGWACYNRWKVQGGSQCNPEPDYGDDGNHYVCLKDDSCNTPISCEAAQWHDEQPYSCQDGFACYSRWKIVGGQQCDPEKDLGDDGNDYICLPDESCNS